MKTSYYYLWYYDNPSSNINISHQQHSNAHIFQFNQDSIQRCDRLSLKIIFRKGNRFQSRSIQLVWSMDNMPVCIETNDESNWSHKVCLLTPCSVLMSFILLCLHALVSFCVSFFLWWFLCVVCVCVFLRCMCMWVAPINMNERELYSVLDMMGQRISSTCYSIALNLSLHRIKSKK